MRLARCVTVTEVHALCVRRVALSHVACNAVALCGAANELVAWLRTIQGFVACGSATVRAVLGR